MCLLGAGWAESKQKGRAGLSRRLLGKGGPVLSRQAAPRARVQDVSWTPGPQDGLTRVSPKPQNMTLFPCLGGRSLQMESFKRSSYWTGVCPTSGDWCPYEKRKPRDKEAQPREHRGRPWRDVVTSQGMPGCTRSWKRQEESPHPPPTQSLQREHSPADPSLPTSGL